MRACLHLYRAVDVERWSQYSNSVDNLKIFGKKKPASSLFEVLIGTQLTSVYLVYTEPSIREVSASSVDVGVSVSASVNLEHRRPSTTSLRVDGIGTF